MAGAGSDKPESAELELTRLRFFAPAKAASSSFIFMFACQRAESGRFLGCRKLSILRQPQTALINFNTPQN